MLFVHTDMPSCLTNPYGPILGICCQFICIFNGGEYVLIRSRKRTRPIISRSWVRFSFRTFDFSYEYFVNQWGILNLKYFNLIHPITNFRHKENLLSLLLLYESDVVKNLDITGYFHVINILVFFPK